LGDHASHATPDQYVTPRSSTEQVCNKEILTPIIQRQALDIPPATLFAFQILLGVVFGIRGRSLALPLLAVVKVLIDHFKADQAEAGIVQSEVSTV